MNLIFVARVRRFERVLLDLKLTLEQIDRVFELRIGNAVYRNSVGVALKGACENQLVKLVNQVVNVSLEYLESLLCFITELGNALLNESVHILDVLEINTGDFFIRISDIAFAIVKVSVLTNLY